MNVNELKRGHIFELDGELFQVIELSWTMPGKGPAYMPAKLRNVRSGAVIEKRLRGSDKVELAYFDRKPMTFLYRDAEKLVFMDDETYEQVELAEEATGDGPKYLVADTKVTLLYAGGELLGVELPNTVDLKVVETPPVLKGATVTNQYKPATLETGYKVNVPPFIETGEVVRIDTRTGEYLERAK
jgi:elongation factor P